MKTTRSHRTVFQRTRTWICLAGLVLAAGTGCATRHQVQSIVAESNEALLAAQLPEVELSGDPKSANRPPDPAAVAKKIDDFIAAHPDQPVANSPLRVRQAMLFIVCEKYELGRAAFGEATELKTDRDKALKNASEPIIWWWQNARLDHWNPDLTSQAQQQIAALDKQIATVQASVDIRDYLAEMRARMAFQLSKSTQKSPAKKEIFVEAVNRYASSLTTSDVAAINAGNLPPKTSAIAPEEKRRLRALGVITKAKEAAEDLRAGGQPVTSTDLAEAARPFGELVLAQ